MGAGFHGGFGNTHGANENHKDYIENTLPKTSLLPYQHQQLLRKKRKMDMTK